MLFLLIGLSIHSHKAIPLNAMPNKLNSASVFSAHTEKSLTLKEAIIIAQQEALKWNKRAMLYNGLSIDRDELPTGFDGKRSAWNFQFGIPGQTDFLLVNMRDGQIWKTLYLPNELDTMPENYFISNIKDIKFDSPELLIKGKKEVELYPGDVFAKGYNFGITKDPQKNIPLVMVIGWDQSKKSMIYLMFNTVTGELENRVERRQYIS